MASGVRRSAAQRISYKESSSEDESMPESSDRDELARTQSSRKVSLRSPRVGKARRISYKEPSSDVEPISEESADESQRPAKRPRTSTSSHNSPAQRLLRGNAASPSVSRTRRGSARPSPSKAATKRSRGLGAPRPARGTRSHIILPSVPTDGKIPPWTTLPFDILVSIFRFAAEPMREPALLMQTPSVAWLLQASRICKAFCEPALTVLYDNPPLSALHQPHDLLDLLRTSEDSTMLQYRTKVKQLHLEARTTLQYTAANRGLFNLSELLQYTPLLSEVDISDIMDRPPFRLRGPQTKYNYPDDLFASFESNGLKLKSWRWNGSMMKDMSLDTMKDIHSSSSFSTLRHLTVSQLKLATPRKTSSRKSDMVEVNTIDPSTRHAQFAASLNPLVGLKGLSLESIVTGDFDDIGQWDWISLLPKDLESLTIINAPYLDTETLSAFLMTHGSELRQLDVSHNQLLDLRFLTTLGQACPKLERLRMDCTYYSPIELSKDSDPLYDSLLDAESIPTWPETLQELELMQLRKWDSDAAKTFFMSLIDSAPKLMSLKKIYIKANLDVSWRERAGFRDMWIHRMQEIFLDKSPPPNPHLASFRAWRMWKAQAPTRSHAMDERSRRITRADIEVEDEFLTDRFVQGNCSVVDVNIDNLRPTEHQFTERDFVDSEQSGDDEWRGDPEPSSPRYAW